MRTTPRASSIVTRGITPRYTLIGAARRLTLWNIDDAHLITLDPDKRSGQACIRGLRMTVRDVLEYLAAGITPQEIVEEFPDLTLEDIRACLAYAADRERRLWVVPAA